MTASSRDFSAAPSEGMSGEVGASNGAPPDANALETPDRDTPADSMPAAVTGGSATCDADGNCECAENGESCSPIALCADGNSACDATARAA